MQDKRVIFHSVPNFGPIYVIRLKTLHLAGLQD